MNKLNNILKNNIKLIFGLILGITLTYATVAAANTLFQAEEIKYNNSTSKLTSTNVQGALNELDTKANNLISQYELGTPVYYAYGTYKGWCSDTDTNCNSYSDFPTTSTTPPTGYKEVYAAKYEDGQYGVCIKRNGTDHCFRSRNWISERIHIKKVFSDIKCEEYSDKIRCNASDVTCYISSDGYVICLEHETNSDCRVNSNGRVLCSSIGRGINCNVDSWGSAYCG